MTPSRSLASPSCTQCSLGWFGTDTIARHRDTAWLGAERSGTTKTGTTASRTFLAKDNCDSRGSAQQAGCGAGWLFQLRVSLQCARRSSSVPERTRERGTRLPPVPKHTSQKKTAMEKQVGMHSELSVVKKCEEMQRRTVPPLTAAPDGQQEGCGFEDGLTYTMKFCFKSRKNKKEAQVTFQPLSEQR